MEGVDREAIGDGGEAGAIAKVRNDGAARQFGAKLAHDGFVRESVETVTAQAFVVEWARESVALRDVGHGFVESGVKACELRHAGIGLLSGFDQFERGRDVERREMDAAVKFGENIRRNFLVHGKFGTAMHDAVADGGGWLRGKVRQASFSRGPKLRRRW